MKLLFLGRLICISIVFLFSFLKSNAQSCTEVKAAFDINVVDFTLTLTNESSNAQSYLWNFGDGTSSTDVDPIHVYNVPGKYDVELIAFCDEDSSVKTKTAKIIGIDADFEYKARGQKVNFKSLSTNTESDSWDFGDGNTSDKSNLVHKYKKSGIYYVCLTSKNQGGSVGTCKYVVTNDTLDEIFDNCYTSYYNADPVNPSVPQFAQLDKSGSEIILLKSGTRIDLVKFSSDGEMVWDNWISKNDSITAAQGMALDRYNNIYVLANNFLLKVDSNGRIVKIHPLQNYSYSAITGDYRGEFIYLMGDKVLGEYDHTVSVVKCDLNLSFIWNTTQNWYEYSYGDGIALIKIDHDNYGNVFSLIEDLAEPLDPNLDLTKISADGKILWTSIIYFNDFKPHTIRMNINNTGQSYISYATTYLDAPKSGWDSSKDFPMEYREVDEISQDGKRTRYVYKTGSVNNNQSPDIYGNYYWYAGVEVQKRGPKLKLLWFYHTIGSYSAFGMQNDSCVILAGKYRTVKLHEDGTEAWAVVGDQIKNPVFIISDSNGNIIVTGTQGDSIYVVKYCNEQPVQKKEVYYRKNKMENNLTVYPNPNDGSFSIKASLEDSKIKSGILEIYNSLFQIISSENISIEDGDIKTHIESKPAWRSGIYFLRLKVGSQQFTGKVYIQ